MSQYNPRTIRRDLALLTEERLYTVEIKVRAGGARVSMVDVADFIPPIEVLDVWNSLSSKTKPPQIRLFESLETAVKTLAEYRRSLYETYTIQLGIDRVIGGTQFHEFLTAYETAKSKSTQLLETVLADHAIAKQQWLETEIRPLLSASVENFAYIDQRLTVYANRFPSYDKIESRFGMEFRYTPTRSYRELLSDNLETKHILTQTAIAEAEYLEANNRQRVSNEEADALRRARIYQDQRIRSAIEEKVTEVRVQVLSVLQRQLQQVVDRGWLSGRLPVGMQRDLESLAESATVLTETDQSFSEIADRLEQVQATGRDRNQPEAELQFQVQQLLQQIQNRLTVPETDVIETYDRSAFVDFGWEMPIAS